MPHRLSPFSWLLFVFRRRLAHDRATPGSNLTVASAGHPLIPCLPPPLSASQRANGIFLTRLARYRIPFTSSSGSEREPLAMERHQQRPLVPWHPTSCVAVPCQCHLPCSSQKPAAIAFRGLMPCARRGAARHISANLPSLSTLLTLEMAFDVMSKSA